MDTFLLGLDNMIYRLTADFIVVLHLAFILFAAFGGLLVLKYPRSALLHLPALLWAVLISLAGWVCPLTALENWLRERGDLLGYDTSSLEHYILPAIYPGELTRGMQIFLGLLVLVINLGIYRCGFVLTWRLTLKQHQDLSIQGNANNP